MKRYKPLQIIFLIFIFIFSISAQSSPQSQVSVNVTVTDAQGHFVEGLTEKDFQLFDNGRKTQINEAIVDDSALSTGFLIDISDSVAKNAFNRSFSRVNWGRDAVLDFLQASQENNEYFLMTFSEEIVFFSEFQKKDKIIKLIQDNSIFTTLKVSETAFYDSLISAIEKISNGKNKRKVLFLLTDGEDTKSFVDKGLVKLATMSEALIYVISILDVSLEIDLRARGYNLPTGLEDHAKLKLNQLTDNSGGKAFYLSKLEDVKVIASSIATSLRKQYRITFTPKIDKKKDKWRDLKVKINIPPDRKKILGELYINHRKGYFTNSKTLPTN